MLQANVSSMSYFNLENEACHPSRLFITLYSKFGAEATAGQMSRFLNFQLLTVEGICTRNRISDSLGEEK
jgi:hypothetical protein